ncbi:MAG: hypothetical protein COS89_02110 [Deltaproteobacteria bacterium CG07_land_8_20_14_0_80_38_7]|nr:MAG: hypothetical protein COS89_02110 [Deltaproteobacteria bacterium CG07_land_8_20_14_0_80_38_7]
MDIIPIVRNKFRRRRTEKILDKGVIHGSDLSVSVAERCNELSIHNFIDNKMECFFARLGKQEAFGLYETVINQVEKSLIKRAMKWANGNHIKASRLLGINRNTLRSKIKKLNLKV